MLVVAGVVEDVDWLRLQVWALVLLDSVPGLTHPPTKEKKVGLKWLRMDFKGMFFFYFFFNRI